MYTFRFDKPEGLTWLAGQYGLFTITHRPIKHATRPFSFASAPAENVVQLTMRIGDTPSDFKKAMLELKPGMKMKMSGPVGSFYLTDDRPSLLIAGGIGITPFRSILKQVEANGKAGEKRIHLLYLDSSKTYVFREELDRIASQTSISVTYLDSRNDLQQEIGKFTSLHTDNGKYFVAGPKTMTDSISASLEQHHVAKRDIKIDIFAGYS